MPVVGESGAARHRLRYLTEHNVAFADLADRVQNLSSTVFGDEYRLLDDAMDGVVYHEKRRGGATGYERIRWHVDFPPDHPLSPVYTAGLYLHDSHRANGCLAVVPMSHRFPDSVEHAEPMFVEVRAGTLVCHDEAIAHGSAAMSVDGVRGTIYHYMYGGARPKPRAPFIDPERLADTQALFTR